MEPLVKVSFYRKKIMMMKVMMSCQNSIKILIKKCKLDIQIVSAATCQQQQNRTVKNKTLKRL
eukprot:10604402-Ditylum_brightwellii.AAC.1